MWTREELDVQQCYCHSSGARFKAQTGVGHLRAFSTADPIFVQSDKHDRASPRKLFFLEGLLCSGSLHGQLGMTLFPSA